MSGSSDTVTSTFTVKDVNIDPSTITTTKIESSSNNTADSTENNNNETNTNTATSENTVEQPDSSIMSTEDELTNTTIQ